MCGSEDSVRRRSQGCERCLDECPASSRTTECSAVGASTSIDSCGDVCTFVMFGLGGPAEPQLRSNGYLSTPTGRTGS